MLNDNRGGAAQRASAGVPARGEGRRSHWFDRIVEEEALFRSIGLGRGRGRDHMSVPQPSVVEGPGEYVQVRFAPLVSSPGPGDRQFGSRVLLLPPVAPASVSFASGSYHFPVVGKNQDGNPDQSVTLNDLRVVRKQVGRVVVQRDPPPKPRRPCNIKQKRRRRLEFEEGLESSRWFYDPRGTWPSFAGRMPWMHSWSDVPVEAHGSGTRDVSCGPSLWA